MKLSAFKIQNFRSIVDSGWVPFSPDGITVLVGQNESGKSSVLQALYFSLSGAVPTEDDFRIGTDAPVVDLRIQIPIEKFDGFFKEIDESHFQGFKDYLEATHGLVDLECRWLPQTNKDKQVMEHSLSIRDERLVALIKLRAFAHDEDLGLADHVAIEQEEIAPIEVDTSTIAEELWRALPLGILFNEELGQLPNQVDIDSEGKPTGPGARAAMNFLQIAEINLPDLIKCDRRVMESKLNLANSKVNKDFNVFWSQTIGKSGRLALKCDIDKYDATHAEKAGHPHLVFWICDGPTQLYPKQRSQGVRWFVSFYLQLKASEKARNRRVFLLDEPGANLHSKAQGDVLKLINQLGKETSSVVYSTHSPQMLEYSKLFRVHAVQRDGDLDDSPTQIIDAHRLGTASTDTLSPILTAMGADLSQHQVVRKVNNVLLEEMSGYYYLSSFWKLLAVDTEAHFIAATGVNKIEALANMFRGWGLEFIVAMDDDKQGREAYNSMKREMFGDDANLASKKMIKLPGCVAIEDVLSKDDFAKFVLSDPSIKIEGTNAEYVKSKSRSKPVLGFGFALAVDRGEISWASLSAGSQSKISEIVEAIKSRLKPTA